MISILCAQDRQIRPGYGSRLLLKTASVFSSDAFTAGRAEGRPGPLAFSSAWLEAIQEHRHGEFDRAFLERLTSWIRSVTPAD
jgi:hypothetical protein